MWVKNNYFLNSDDENKSSKKDVYTIGNFKSGKITSKKK